MMEKVEKGVELLFLFFCFFMNFYFYFKKIIIKFFFNVKL